MKFFLPILFLFFSTICIGQISKSMIVGIATFESSNDQNKERAAELQDIVSELFQAKKYMTCLDRTKMMAIESELKAQRKGNYVEGITVAQNKSFGAQQLVIGSLSKYDAVESRTSTKNVTTSSYKIAIGFSLNVFDVETGKILAQKTFDVSARSGGLLSLDMFSSFDSKEDALVNGVRKNKKEIQKLVDFWINEQFPPLIKIVAIDEVDKDGFPSLVSIVGGSEANVKKGQEFTILEVQVIDVDGVQKKKKTPIGALKVVELLGDFTSCKVTNGEEAIGSKWKSANIEIIVKEAKKKLF